MTSDLPHLSVQFPDTMQIESENYVTTPLSQIKIDSSSHRTDIFLINYKDDIDNTLNNDIANKPQSPTTVVINTNSDSNPATTTSTSATNNQRKRPIHCAPNEFSDDNYENDAKRTKVYTSSNNSGSPPYSPLDSQTPTTIGIKRSRGRPKGPSKSSDHSPQAETDIQFGTSIKQRGRPKGSLKSKYKYSRTDIEDDINYSNISTPNSVEISNFKRTPGRPPKTSSPFSPTPSSSNTFNKIKSKRGRPTITSTSRGGSTNNSWDYGRIVWGKIKRCEWWPGVVIAPSVVGKKSTPQGCQWVCWYGECQYSDVFIRNIKPITYFSHYFNPLSFVSHTAYKAAIFEVIAIAEKRVQFYQQKVKSNSIPANFLKTVDFSFENYVQLKNHKERQRELKILQELDESETLKIKWALTGFAPGGLASLQQIAPSELNPIEPCSKLIDSENELSNEEAIVMDANHHNKINNLWLNVFLNRQKSSKSENEKKFNKENIISLRNKKIDIKDFCIGCYKHEENIKQHPLIYGGLCSECYLEFTAFFYLFDSEGLQEYCSLCAGGSHLVICNNKSCWFCFCHDCIEDLSGPDNKMAILSDNNWQCFICQQTEIPQPLTTTFTCTVPSTSNESSQITVQDTMVHFENSPKINELQNLDSTVQNNINILKDTSELKTKNIEYIKTEVLCCSDQLDSENSLLDSDSPQPTESIQFETDTNLLRVRSDWDLQLRKVFENSANNSHPFSFRKPKIPPPLNAKSRKSLRVLALFDGIGSGLVALEELGLKVDYYLSSEIDHRAVTVANINRSKIKQIGDIKNITLEDIKNWGPFDLVCGGSPIEDLSTDNLIRKGLYDQTGTGPLFFDFYRILGYCLPDENENRPFFWFFENTASMKSEEKETISRFLGCDPSVVECKYFSAIDNRSFVWGNLPGMERPPRHENNAKLRVQDCLESNCGRIAKCDKLKNSLIHNSREDSLPVHITMEGSDMEEDNIWVTEQESMNGLPHHYTDVGNLNLTDRYNLLENTFCVPVIKHLIAPLKSYFSSNINSDSNMNNNNSKNNNSINSNKNSSN